jgi:hypothetical protein
MVKWQGDTRLEQIWGSSRRNLEAAQGDAIKTRHKSGSFKLSSRIGF